MSWLKKRLPQKRWKRVCIYLFSIFVILLAADMLLVQYWRHITISPETTRITSPLKPDGLPDYVAARNAECSQGVTAENNAAPGLLAIIGTAQFPKVWREQVLPQLGMSPAGLPTHLVGYQDWQNAHMPATVPADASNADDYRNDDWNQTMRAPWKSSAHPDRAAWLESQHETLIQLDAALREDRFYVPWNSLDPAETTDAVMPLLSGSRTCGYLLTVDAMRAAGDGDAVAFRRDLLDIAKLARLVSQGSTLLDYMVAVAIQDEASLVAQHGTATLFLKANEVDTLFQSWLAMPAFPDESRVLDTGERYVELNSICKWPRRGNANLFFPIHYNGTLRTYNHYFDELVAAYRLPTYTQRRVAIQATEEECVTHRNWLSIGDLLISILMPSLGKSVEMCERTQIDCDLALLSIALRVYREEHGVFPSSLAELAPQILSQLPQDGFTDAPFHYRREVKGYVLYSVGPDGKDDGGLDRQGAAKAGVKGWDIVVRCVE